MRTSRFQTLRCFPTKCRNCEAAVLYWESTSGAKAFFNLPAYGRLQRHHCPNRSSKKTHQVIATFEDHQRKKYQKSISFQCPVCGKIFEKEPSLVTHLKKLAKQDDAHGDFMAQVSDLISWSPHSSDKDQDSPISAFQTRQRNTWSDDRFVLKGTDPAELAKYAKLQRRRKRKPEENN